MQGKVALITGGTALSLGVQTETITGQVAIEPERAEEQMKELNEAIDRTGAILSTSRLREHYDLGDETIEELHRSR